MEPNPDPNLQNTHFPFPPTKVPPVNQQVNQQQRNLSRLGDYLIFKTIAKGNKIKVKLGVKLSEPDTLCALKVLNVSTVSPNGQILLLRAMSQESVILQKLSGNPWVIKVYEFQQTTYWSRKKQSNYEAVYVAMEYLAGGDLIDHLPANGYDENTTRYLFKKIVEALTTIHDSKIVHRDIKPQNIMLDAQAQLKIVDFGFSTVYNKGELLVNCLGTKSFMAPEMFFLHQYCPEQTEIFALGVTLFVLSTGRPMFKAAKGTDNHYKCYVTQKEDYWAWMGGQIQPKVLSPELVELICALVQHQPASRWTLNDIKERSAWFQQPVDETTAKTFLLNQVIELQKKLHSQIAVKVNLNRSDSSGTNFDQSISNVEITDLSELPETRDTRIGVLVTCKRALTVAELAARSLAQLHFIRDTNIQTKLIYELNHELKVQIKIYALGNDEYDVVLICLNGDRFEFAKSKREFTEALMRNCDEQSSS